MRFELFVAARYLRAKRRQAVIGVITAISILGVAAGVASLIIALAINNGFRQDLQERLLGSTSHVNLMRVENDGIQNWPALQAAAGETSPRAGGGSGHLRAGADFPRGRAGGAVLEGMSTADERRVTTLLDSVQPGQCAAAGRCRGAAQLQSAIGAQRSQRRRSPASREEEI